MRTQIKNFVYASENLVIMFYYNVNNRMEFICQLRTLLLYKLKTEKNKEQGSDTYRHSGAILRHLQENQSDFELNLGIDEGDV